MQPPTVHQGEHAPADNLPAEHRQPIVLDELLSRCLGNEEFAARMLRRFEELFSANMSDLKEAYQQGDVCAMATLAHKMKGSAANVGARPLASTLAQMENSARDSELPASSFLQTLNCQWDEALTFIRSNSSTEASS